MKHSSAILAAAAVALTVIAVAPIAGADPVSVRVGDHEGYGRIVFNWPSPVPFTARVTGGQLVVSFQRPVESNFAGIPGALGTYVRAPRLSSGGRVVTFPLLGQYSVRSFTLGRAVIVDLVDPPRAPTATAAPAAPSARASPRQASPRAPANLPSVAVRRGEHEGYSRLVFDWPRQVPYRVDRNGGQTSIVFQGVANIQVAAINRRPPKYILGARSVSEGGATTVTLNISPASRIRNFRSGPKVVVDVLKPEGSALAAVPAAAAPTAAAAAPPATEKPKPAQASRQKAPAPTPAPVPATALRKAPPQAPAKTAATGAAPASPVKLTPSGPARGTAGPAPEAAQPAVSGAGSQPSVSLRIPWNEQVAAAVFRRAGNLWIVFDKSKEIDVQGVKRAGGNLVREVKQIPTEGATVLRIATISGINPTVRRDNLAWIFDLKQQPIAAQTEIEAKSQPNSPVGARLFLPVEDVGNAIPLRDPEVGDNLVVVPVLPLGYGVSRLRDYAQMRILPTAQGLVIQPRVDDLRVRPIGQGVELTSASSLQLSQPSTKAEAGAKITSFQTLSRVFEPDVWRRARRETLADFTRRRQELLLAISRAEGTARKSGRYELARFFFGQGFGPETIAVLDQIAKSDEPAVNEPQFKALSGGANFLMWRLEDAERDFSHSSLQDNDEAEFWRAIVKVALGEKAEMASELKRLGSIYRPYPRALRMLLGMTVVEAAVAANDIKLGADYLEALGEEEPTPKEVDQLAYLEGQLKKLAGDFGGAVAAWEEVEKGEHRPSRAKAIVARAELLLGLNQITPEEAIDEFEKLRYAWRGGEFEFDLLRKLGRLYLNTGQYGKGLRVLRQAASYFRNNEAAPLVTQELAQAFARLYLDDEADSMPPVQAIGLFDEFKELAPLDERGDEMIRKLADRLVAVDLLDRAAKLLKQQVEFRLKGVQKARVGSQLALVQLLNRQPAEAEKSLDKTEVAGISAELANQRRQLRARSLVDQNRQAEALLLIEDDETREADLLRTEIYWNGRDWARASQVLRRLVTASGAVVGEALDETQANYVLNHAVALTLSGNQRGLARTRRDFGPAMSKTKLKDAFNLISSPNSVGLVDYRTIAGKVKEVTNFRAFMTAYRDRLKSSKLSKVN